MSLISIGVVAGGKRNGEFGRILTNQNPEIAFGF